MVCYVRATPKHPRRYLGPPGKHHFSSRRRRVSGFLILWGTVSTSRSLLGRSRGRAPPRSNEDTEQMLY